ncbi:uncharacterized protein LOC114559161 isoform X2 [Perca flavescens]|uniref:uncharacterized protein LOC114559161 isoform X2 n=1 Tax=Perca flavescens TaxID=8167 RepID=UPI00106EFE61|nr:uncharacterized protein LOC114559161 isoform X2 [Perca flavescens]
MLSRQERCATAPTSPLRPSSPSVPSASTLMTSEFKLHTFISLHTDDITEFKLHTFIGLHTDDITDNIFSCHLLLYIYINFIWNLPLVLGVCVPVVVVVLAVVLLFFYKKITLMVQTREETQTSPGLRLTSIRAALHSPPVQIPPTRVWIQPPGIQTTSTLLSLRYNTYDDVSKSFC